MDDSADFDLTIATGATSGTYLVAVDYAAGAVALPPQPLPATWDVAMLPRRRRDVAEWVAQARITRLRTSSPELEQARAFGKTLFEGLFHGEVLACLRESRRALAPGARLRVRLHIPPELAVIPWELLYDPREQQFLVLSQDISLLRCPPEIATPLAPLRINGPLQVAVVLASPARYPPINLDRELRSIELALRAPIADGRVTLDIIRGAGTLDQLRARLRQPLHVLHVLCHGDIDPHDGEGLLIFEDPLGDAEQVTAALLRLQIQKQQGQTRLVVLNACLGALAGGNDPFGSVGAALIRGGVPAVVAMQFEIPEESAADLTRVLYTDLASGMPVDSALSEARLDLYGRAAARLDWAVPVLFSRAGDGALFEGIEPGAAAPAATTDQGALRSIWQQASAAYYAQEWDRAATLLRQVLALDATHADAQRLLAETQQQIQRGEDLRQQVLDACRQREWRRAEQILLELQREAPLSDELNRLLLRTQREQRRGLRDWRVLALAGSVGLLLLLLAVWRLGSGTPVAQRPTAAPTAIIDTSPSSTPASAAAAATPAMPAPTPVPSATPAPSAVPTPTATPEPSITPTSDLPAALDPDQRFTDFAVAGSPPAILRRLTIDEWQTYVSRYDFGERAPSQVVLIGTDSSVELRDAQTWRGAETLGALQAAYKREGWSAGPHIFVAADGIWLFTPMREIGIHSGPGNSGTDAAGQQWYSIGVELVGDYTTARPDGRTWEYTRAVLGGLAQRLDIPPERLIVLQRAYFPRRTSPGAAITQEWVVQEVAAWLAAPP